MIVVDEGEELLLITQPDHAHFSGELLALWTADGLPTHPRRDQLLLAAREHDNGWREADAAPRLDPNRCRPHDFLTIPDEVRFDIWERGTLRFATRHPYAALLITQHALHLHEQRREGKRWGDFLTLLEERRTELMEQAETELDELLSDYRWIDLTDLLSLAACNRWGRSFQRHGVRGTFDGTSLSLDPFPLVGATTFRVPCRRVPRRDYSGDADLGASLAAARWQEIAVRVEPARA